MVYYSAGRPAAVGLQQMVSPANAVIFQTAKHSATTVVESQDDARANASQQAPAERANSDAQQAFGSAPLEKSLLSEGQDLTSGQHLSKADSLSAAQAQRQLSHLSVEAAADRSSAHAGDDQLTQHNRAVFEHESPEGVTCLSSGGISTGVSGPAGITDAGIAADQSPAQVGSRPNDANQSSNIASQRAAAVSSPEQPDAVTRLADIPLVHSSDACSREEACGPGTQPEAPAASVVGMADHCSRQDPQSYKGGPQDMEGNSKNPQGSTGGPGNVAGNSMDPQGSTGCPSNVAGNSSQKDPQGSTGGPQQGSEAAHSPSAIRPSSERRSASSSPAQDAPECSPADVEPVLMENQVIVPPGKRLSQSSAKSGISLDVKGSDFSKSQDLTPVEHTKVGHPAEQAAANADLDDKATMASEVEAANKENDVSSASLAASDSQAGAQAVMEEEQAKAAAAAAAQVVLACLSACCVSCVEGSQTSTQLHCLAVAVGSLLTFVV